MEGDRTIDPVQVDGVLLTGVGAGAQHVAGIEEDRAGHDGVQVDDAERLTAIEAEEDVVHLRVVVGDAQRQSALPESIGEHAAPTLVLFQERQLIGDEGHS